MHTPRTHILWLATGLLAGLLIGSALQCRPQATDADTGQSAAAPGPDSLPAVREIDPVRIVSTAEEATIRIFEEAAPSVVFITTTAVREDYWTQNIYEIPAGTGSGFVWDDQGHIVTNYHVIQNAYKAKVTLADQTTLDADIIGVEPRKDLAVLKIKPPAGLKALPIGTSSNLKVGQSVFAIGNPFGLDQTLTTGVISALGREIQSVARIPIRDVIQTDAAINPGNSGGPLLDISGRLIGVNTAIYSPSGTYAGIGFSVPVDVVNWVVPDLIAYGQVQRPILGIELVNQRIIDRMGLQGALVNDVAPDSPAAKAGIRPTRRLRSGEVELGDLIVKINDEPIRHNDDLLLSLEKFKPGDQIQVTINRSDKLTTIPVILERSR